MRVFVTGGAGFIGSHLVDHLISEGHELTAYDNLSSGKKEFIEHHIRKPTFALVEADLLDLDKLKNAIRGHDVVFHLAANPEARWGIENTELDLKQETIATYNILESMRVNGVKKIVFSSSGTIYGETPTIPLPEDYGPALPISLYGAGKLASEGLISAFCGTFNMQAWIFRFANVVGKRTTHGVIFDFIQKLKQNPHKLEILGDGKQCKPYLHVEDCVDGILFGFKNSHDKVNVFNLGCSTATNVTTIAKMLVEGMGLNDVKFKYTGGDRGWPGDVPQVRFNVHKMSRLGWKARYTSDEAVKKAIWDILHKGWD
ncbi:MAG: NAD-dependent epimerase/dehydratase family protein [Dehalococcoidia bacterium]|jgi:UDP-glucose 4-epimerase